MKKNSSIILTMVFVLVVGSLIISFNDVLVRILGKKGNIFQYLLLREIFMTLLLAPFWFKQSKAGRSQGKSWIQVARAHLLILGSGGVFIALKYMPLASANAVFYTAPILTVFAASVVLKDQIRFYQIVTGFTAFVGMLIVVKPDEFNWAVIAALVTAVTLAISNILPRLLSFETTNMSIMFWSNFYTIPTLAFLGAFFWEPIGIDFIALCFASSLCLGAYQYSTIISYRKVNAAIIAIVEYSGLVFVSILAWIIFNESLDLLSILGIAMIILPTVLQTILDRNRVQDSDIVKPLPLEAT